MARVDKIDLNIDGKEYSYNINVGKKGVFSVKIDWDVLKKINLSGSDLSDTVLDNLRNRIITAYYNYLDSTKVEEMYIFIKYAASGKFVYNSSGKAMFSSYKNKFSIDTFSKPTSNLVGVSFKVFILEKSSTGNELWYSTRKGDPSSIFPDRKDEIENELYKDSQEFGKPDGIMIPYSEKAVNTLEKAIEGLRSISEILFDFVSKEPEEISNILESGNILKIE